AGFCAAGGGLAAVSVLLGGGGIVRQYYELLTRKDIKTLDPMPVRMISIRSLAWNLGIDSPVVGALLIAVVVALVLIVSWRASLWRWFASACTGTILVAPHVYNYDAGILLLPILLAIFCSTNKITRFLAATLSIPIPHMVAFFGPPYSMLPVLIMVLFL